MIDIGIALASHCLRPKIERATKTRPSTKTAVKASSYLTGPVPWTPTTVYVKYALRPIPGARAIGMLAQRPIINEVRAAIAAVPVTKSRLMTPRQRL